MNSGKRYQLKERATKVLDVAYDRIETLILNNRAPNKITNDVLLGRISGVLTDASNRIDDAIDYIGQD